MQYIFLIFMPFALWATDLNTLFEKVQESNLYKGYSENIDATMQGEKSSMIEDSWSIGASVGYADVRDTADSATEFELSISRNFQFNSSKIDNFLQTNQRYALLQKEIEKNRLKVKLWQLYGMYCINMKALQAKGELSSVYDEIRLQIEKGVEYGEFDTSKAIMAKLSLDNLNLQISKLDNLVQDYESQIKSIVAYNSSLECKEQKPDIYKLFNPENSVLEPLLQTKIEQKKYKLSLAAKNFSSVEVGASYANEIDTDRYMINLSFPLALGEKNQAQQVAALHQLSASNYELEAFRNSYIHNTSTLENRLEIYTKYLSSTENSIMKLSNVLIKQSNMRFRAGEDSFISMLKATETKAQMIESILDLKIDRHNAVAKYMYDYAIDPQGVIK